MNVRKLVEELSKLDPERIVCYSDNEYGLEVIRDVDTQSVDDYEDRYDLPVGTQIVLLQ